MPYRVQEPYIIVNGQRLTSPTEPPQRLPWCDQCNTLAANLANLYTELSPKWWEWFSFPKFSCEENAFMGCAAHPVEPEIRFLDGRVERFINLPPTRWERMKEPEGLIVAAVLAVIFAIVVDRLSGLFSPLQSHAMISHLVNLLIRSWNATTAGYGTTTLGFILWVVLFTVLLWFAGVFGTWITLRRKKLPASFKEIVRNSLMSGVFSVLCIVVIAVISYSVFFVRTIYQDHQTLANRVATLEQTNADVKKELELRKRSIVTGDPVFVHTIYLLQAFNIYRHALNGKRCVLMITAPADSKEGGAIGSMVAQFSNSVSGCFTFGPMDANADPDVEKRAEEGMVPDKIVFHADRGNPAAEQLFMNLGNLIQSKRSYDMPPASARAHLYSIPNPGDEEVIWLQFGSNVKWNN